MEFPRRVALPLTAAIGLLSSSAAYAQYINDADRDRSVPARAQGEFSEQPLIPRPGDITVIAGPLANPLFGSGTEAGIRALRVPSGLLFFGGSDLFWSAQAGAAVGVAKPLELGILTPALQFAPESDVGDLPIFMTLATSQGSTDLGLRTTLTVPLSSDSRTRLNPGGHALVRFDGGRFDLGLFFPLTFVEGNTVASLEVPLRLTFDLSSGIHLGVSSGVRKLGLGEDATNDVFIPAGAHAVYSLEAGDHRIDFTGQFNWELFFWAGGPEGVGDRVIEDFYSISLGANLHFDTGGN